MADDETLRSEISVAAGAAVPNKRLDTESDSLHRTARWLAVALTLIAVAGFVLGRSMIEQSHSLQHILGVALMGMAGSGVGALTSLLGRYAAGFELDDGTRVPPQAEGEVYNRRIGFCMLMRPVMGLLVAPLIVVGVALFFKSHEDFKDSVDAVTVVAFIGGLYAKSVLEAAKNAFKVVFRA